MPSNAETAWTALVGPFTPSTPSGSFAARVRSPTAPVLLCLPPTWPACPQVFPEHKYLVVEILRQLGHKTGMTGDGVNDAPALHRADVGVAVQGATDAARAAADIVLTQPGLSTIVDAIVISRVIFQRMRNFLTYRIAATLQLLVFFFVAVLAQHPMEYLPSTGVPE